MISQIIDPPIWNDAVHMLHSEILDPEFLQISDPDPIRMIPSDLVDECTGNQFMLQIQQDVHGLHCLIQIFAHAGNSRVDELHIIA